ncbi:fimbrillin family protein [Parabacteroides distasonis]|nr:fimbrillin family protein [Parabacteroides distasonis]
MMAIGLLLAGCSADEEIANVRTSESNVIGFNVVSNNPQTKAEIIHSTTFTNYPFEVFALKDGQSFIGNSSSEWRGGVTIKYDTDNAMWNYANQEDILYWPHVEALDFYAISPATFHFSNWIINGDKQELQVAVHDEYAPTVSSSETNVDLMYAYALQQKKSDTQNGEITLQFKHALSQVLFKAKKRDENLRVEIKSIEIANVYGRGTFSFPTLSTSGAWSGYLLPMSYTVGMEPSVPIKVTAVGDPETQISGNKPMLFIPQTLEKWDPKTTTIKKVDETKDRSYLKITCKIYQEPDGGNNHYFIPREGEQLEDGYGVMYVPFEATWESGKRYVYTLCFGAGYDENGKEYDIVPITFEADVENWVETSVDKGDF